MNKTARIALGIIIAAALAAVCVFAGWSLGRQSGKAGAADTGQSFSDTRTESSGRETDQMEKNTDTIDIPGYDAIYLQADVTDQRVSLYNPEQNTCYFQMSLLLSDGTLLWKSDLVEPGQEVDEITLDQTLQAGEYEAVLKYDCFAMDEDQTPLNGSEIKLTLKVLD